MFIITTTTIVNNNRRRLPTTGTLGDTPFRNLHYQHPRRPPTQFHGHAPKQTLPLSTPGTSLSDKALSLQTLPPKDSPQSASLMKEAFLPHPPLQHLFYTRASQPHAGSGPMPVTWPRAPAPTLTSPGSPSSRARASAVSAQLV